MSVLDGDQKCRIRQEYREVLETCIREVGEALGDTVPNSATCARLYLSPPPVRLPFTDHESGFFQIAGDKRIQIFDREDRDVISAKQLRDHWHETPQSAIPAALRIGKWFDMLSGTGVHCPCFPHW